MKLVSVDELFGVAYGTSLELNALEERVDGVPFISRTTQNNGVSARVSPVAGVKPLPAGVLTVALSGSPLATFLQEEPFYTGYHVAVLQPREPMSRDTLLYYATCLQANRYRFSYGRQANRSLASLLLPPTSEVPGWVAGPSPDAAGSVWHELRSSNCVLAAPSAEALDTEEWARFTLEELFDVRKGKRLTKEDMTDGPTLYVGATELNNGVTALVGQQSLHPGGQLTVSYNGSVAEAFFQPEPFWASDDVNVLYPKFDMTPELALFFCTLIRLEKYRYNYGRKWRLDVMRATKLRLPRKADGSPNWNVMQELVRACPSHGLLSKAG